MNYTEAIKNLTELVNEPEKLSIDKIEQFLANVSITDNVAPEGAATHLYTKMGSDTSFINNSVRVLDHTDAAKVLIYVPEGENVRLYDTAVKIALKNENIHATSLEIDTLLENYLYGKETNGTTGPWAEISRRFAADTKGNVVCHIGDINEAATRTWWNVEIPTNNTDVNFINRAIIAYGDDGNILKVDVTGTGTGDLPEGCTALGYAGSVDSNIKHNL